VPHGDDAQVADGLKAIMQSAPNRQMPPASTTEPNTTSAARAGIVSAGCHVFSSLYVKGGAGRSFRLGNLVVYHGLYIALINSVLISCRQVLGRVDPVGAGLAAGNFNGLHSHLPSSARNTSAIISFLFAVSLYFYRRLLGLSGMVISITSCSSKRLICLWRIGLFG
jgi:hypothetical protein